MKKRFGLGVAILVVAAIGFVGWRWMEGQERRDSCKAVETLCQALGSGDGGVLLEVVVLPQTLAGRTLAEQSEFLTKALRDEVSPEGLAVLRREGEFGPLKDIFPSEAETWAQGAGAKAEDCVAFKLERDGLRAEVVLLKPPEISPARPRDPLQVGQPAAPPRIYRIIRCNNVKQMANSNLLTMENTR